MESERAISEFNEAKFQIIRLHEIWVKCKTKREGGDLIGWRWALDSAKIELWDDIDKIDNNDGKNFIKQFEQIEDDIENNHSNFRKLYPLLVKKETLLRKCQNLAGKGAKYKDLEEDEW